MGRIDLVAQRGLQLCPVLLRDTSSATAALARVSMLPSPASLPPLLAAPSGERPSPEKPARPLFPCRG